MRIVIFLSLTALAWLGCLTAVGAPTTAPSTAPTMTTIEVKSVESTAYEADPQTPREQVVQLAPPLDMRNWLKMRLGSDPFTKVTIEAAPRDRDLLLTANGVTRSELSIAGIELENWSLDLLQIVNRGPSAKNERFQLAGEIRVATSRHRMFVFSYQAKINVRKVHDPRGWDEWQPTNATIVWQSPQEWQRTD